MNVQQIEFVDKNFAKLVKEIIALAEIPTPTNDEVRRAQEVRDQLNNLKLKGVSFDNAGNLWVGWPPLDQLHPPAGGMPVVLFTAHLDTVYPWDIEWKVVSESEVLLGPGVADNSTGVAVLIWIAQFLKELVPNPKNQYILAATVGQGAHMQGIKAIIDQLRDAGLDPTKFLHVAIEGNDLGRINCGGVSMRRYEVTIYTPGGHSWYDAQRPSAIHQAAEIIHQMYEKFKQNPRTATCNVGTVRGGTAINAIAAQASFSVEIRANNDSRVHKIEKRLFTIVASSARKRDVRAETKEVGTGPASPLHQNFPVIAPVVRILKDLKVTPQVRLGLTESNYPLSLGLQSITLGCTHARHTHSIQETMEIPPLKKGLAQFFELIELLERSFPIMKVQGG